MQQRDTSGEGGPPSPCLWLRAAGGPRGLLLLSLAWLAAGRGGGGGRAELWGGRPLGEAEPAARTPPLAREPRPLLRAGPGLPGAPLMASRPGGGPGGVGGRGGRRH